MSHLQCQEKNRGLGWSQWWSACLAVFTNYWWLLLPYHVFTGQLDTIFHKVLDLNLPELQGRKDSKSSVYKWRLIELTLILFFVGRKLWNLWKNLDLCSRPMSVGPTTVMNWKIYPCINGSPLWNYRKNYKSISKGKRVCR